MIIKFACPNCKKTLKVKQELAGKKVKCPGCQKVLLIPRPRPVGTPPAAPPPELPADVDVEALAAAALADQPRPEEAAQEQAPATIEFPCYYCDEKVQVSAELAGKQTPCPHCRRIVKVPMPAKKDPTDWRKLDNHLPSGAKREEQAAPEGAWGTGPTAARVSSQALLEADAVPVVRERVTVRQWIVRGLALTAALVFTAGGIWAFFHYRGLSAQRQALASALEYVEGEKQSALGKEAAAEIHRAAGEYYLRAGRLADARRHFAQCRARLTEAKSGSPERDALLIDLAVTQVDLGGSSDDVIGGTRINWDDTRKELIQTLQNLQSPEARTEAMREVAASLIAKGQGVIAGTLARQLPTDSGEVPELLAVVGLQMQRAGQPEAGTLASDAAELFKPPPPAPGDGAQVAPPPVAPALIALLVALNQQAKAETDLAPHPASGEEPFPVVRLGYVQGWALQGKMAEARKLAGAPGKPASRLQALVAVASVSVERKDPEAGKDVEAALNLLTRELKPAEVSPWVVLHLVRLGAQAGLADRLQEAVNMIVPPDFRGRARLAVLREDLDKQADPEKVADFAKQPGVYPPALEVLARFNARRGNASAITGQVPTWEPEALRPFGYAGVALGLQDAGK